MFKHILLPTDGSELSNKAVKQAIAVAKVHGARITAMNVVGEPHFHVITKGLTIPDLPRLERQLEEARTARAEEMLEAVRRSASEAGVECDAVAPVSNVPYKAILKQAEESGCDVIIMASHGRKGLDALLLGSETVKVLTHSAIPVLVCR